MKIQLVYQFKKLKCMSTRIIYSDQININTNLMSLSISETTGILSTTFSGSMSSYAGLVGSYSSPGSESPSPEIYLTKNFNYILTNTLPLTIPPYTFNFPSNPSNGTTITIRNTSTNSITLSAGSNLVRNVGSQSSVSSSTIGNNRSAMYSYLNGTWYGI